MTASASSPDAWAKFNEDVKTKCAEAAKAEFRRVEVVVDPTGSETYGLALVHGRLKAEKARGAALCVVDKKTGKAEIGTVLSKDVVRVMRPKPAKADAAQSDAMKKAPASTADDSDADMDSDAE
ncbi:hypothetical protein [Rhizobium sp. G21]|uniref:hypothetical protein n=1 Tax=Rhizobium sp. G21 TaxID=2758439 RepID=UPI0016040318|nr:hypothetical protein [Rhizobium sp. G21]MBB1250693.1 hypothetical protein [Rhizobium sp. G21]